MTETQVRRMKTATLKLYSHSLLGMAMSRLLVSLLLAITTFGPAHSQFVTAREYSGAATSNGGARPFVWSIEGEGAASLPAKHPSGFKLCSVDVMTVGSPVYIFGLAQFRFAGDAPDGFVALLTNDGHFIRTEPLSETLGGTALVTFSALDRPLPGPHVYSVLAAKLPEVPVGGLALQCHDIRIHRMKGLTKTENNFGSPSCGPTAVRSVSPNPAINGKVSGASDKGYSTVTTGLFGAARLVYDRPAAQNGGCVCVTERSYYMRTSLQRIALRSGNCHQAAWKVISLIALFAGLTLVTPERAAGACTLGEIDACIKADPSAAEKLLLEELSRSRENEQLTRLGEFYREAPPPIQNYSKAIENLREAAKGSDPQAMKSFAEMLINGEGTAADPNCAIALLEEAASEGLVGPSFTTMGDYYYSLLDYQKALETYQKAADAGDPFAMNRLARMLQNGEGTAADPTQGIILLESAIVAGLPGPSHEALGDYYRTAGDSTKAIQAYQQASDAGEPGAMLGLADMLFKGEGTTADPEKAIDLAEKAAAGGLVGPAYLALGDHYRSLGEFTKALAAYERASEFGEKAATQALADMLFKGEGTKPDPERATDLLIKANLPVPQPGEPADPPTMYVGTRVRIPSLVEIAFDAGFRSEEHLLTAVAVAIGESGSWSAARNWKPDWRYRRCDDDINVVGPLSAWSDDQCQMHSDRGLWQIASLWWPQYRDLDTDDPKKAASAVFAMSKGGTDFSAWDSHQSGYAQSLFDKPHDGWPALAPIIANFLDSKSGKTTKADLGECLDRVRR